MKKLLTLLLLLAWSGIGCGAECAGLACKNYGVCTPINGRCVATVQTCEVAVVCLESGLCGEREGVCVATLGGCMASKLCADLGACRLVDGGCSP